MSRAMRRLLMPALVLALAAPGSAMAEAGKVLFAFGKVEISRDGRIFPAVRGAPVEPGDTVRTSATGLAQLRMKDGAILSLRRGAEMVIEEYRLPDEPATRAITSGGATPRQESAVQAGGRSVLRLVRGAFRTITGLIGRDSDDSYELRTPAATIGIRGTDYGVAICEGNCGDSPDGLYVGVSDGEVFVTNDVGQLVLNDDQYAYVKDATSNPEQKLAPPRPLEDPIETDDEDEDGFGDDDPPPPTGDEGDGTGGDGTPTEVTQPETQDELRPGGIERSFAYGTGPLSGEPTFAGGGRVDRSALALNDAGQVTAFNGAAPSADGSGALRLVGYRIGTAQNVNTGFDPDTGIRWGRWNGGVAQVGTASLDLSEQSLHWITGPERSSVVLPTGGSRSFTLSGNTDPTDQFGNVGFLGRATLDANFTDQTVTSTLDLGINNQVWNASGSGNLVTGTPLFGGNFDVTVNGLSGGNGQFAGFFTHQAQGAGLSYSLNDGTTSVSGSAAFAAGGDADATTPGAR